MDSTPILEISPELTIKILLELDFTDAFPVCAHVGLYWKSAKPLSDSTTISSSKGQDCKTIPAARYLSLNVLKRSKSKSGVGPR